MRTRLILAVLAVVALAACKADRFDISVATGDIAAALAGEPREAPFEMVFEGIGEVDDARRANMERFRRIMAAYMTVDSFVLAPTDTGGTDLEIEGRLPITGAADAFAPFYLAVSPSDDFDGYAVVQIRNGEGFDAMRREMKAVDFMLAPDAVQPVQVLLAGNGEALMVPGAVVDGAPHPLFTGRAGARSTLGFKGGIWEDVGAWFMVNMP